MSGSGERSELVLDCRGMRCPLPVIHLARAAKELTAGGTIVVLATDPAAAADIPAWTRMRGHQVTTEDRGEHTAYSVEVGVQVLAEAGGSGQNGDQGTASAGPSAVR